MDEKSSMFDLLAFLKCLAFRLLDFFRVSTAFYQVKNRKTYSKKKLSGRMKDFIRFLISYSSENPTSPCTGATPGIFKQNTGQVIVEYILLLVVSTTIALLFINLVTVHPSDGSPVFQYWQRLLRVIGQDINT